MLIIGVNWDHPSGASLLEGGAIIASVCEERFSRKKNDIAFPQQSIRYCVGQNNTSKPIDGVGIASLEVSYSGMLYHYATMSVADHIREQREVWYPRLYEGKEIDDALVFQDRWIRDQYPREYWRSYSPEKRVTYSKDSADIIADFIDIDPSKVMRIEHHWCHAYYGYYSSPFCEEKAVVITIDGFGDGLNATISIAENGALKRIYETDQCVLGRIYRHVTLLLGMKPLEHEYKVMGLAPYTSPKHARQAYDILSEVISVNGIEFKWNKKPKDSYFYFRDKFEGLRFDSIAAGLQLWVEDMLCKWTDNIVRETGIDTIVFSGGVSMNVKAMGKVAALPPVKKMFVPGSGSDDSNCIGAAIGAYLRLTGGKPERPAMVPSLYLGSDTLPDAVEAVLSQAEQDPRMRVDRDATPEKVARLLAEGLVIGRCVGNMEFGQRALGNRSLLADPTTPDIVPKINAMIKNRDFWMPFAPVVLDTYEDRYLVNPKEIRSPHMTIAFDTTEEGFQSMRAACHQADHTARAQILFEKDNPGFYAILRAFERITGRGALLNTSFNLHGHPIVNTPQEAYEVFTQSHIDGLLFRAALILKKARPSALLKRKASTENDDGRNLGHSKNFRIVQQHSILTADHQRARERWEHVTKTLEVTDIPLHVDIELTNICDINCIMCERRLMTRPKGRMSFETFQAIISQCREIGVDSAKLNLWGESVLHPGLSEMVAYAKQNSSLILQFNTNANQMTPEVSRGLIRAGLDKLTISVDGVTKETYEAVRCGGNFERVIRNIKAFLDAKRDLRSAVPYVTLQIIRMKENLEEISRFVDFWKDQVDYVSVTNIGSTTGDSKIMSLSVRDTSDVRRKTCEQLWQRLSILWDGTITVCCNDYDGFLKIGHIAQDRLIDLWHGEKLGELRARHKRKDYRGLICDFCIETREFES